MANNIIRNWPLFFGVALIMVGNGLQGTLLGVRAEIEGFDTTTTGLIMSLYYGGYLAGSLLAPKLVSNVGHIRVFSALASLASAVTLLHGVFVDPFWWCLARVIAGFCFAGLYIVIESWMNDISDNETRGKILGTYLLVFYGAMVGGQYLLNLAPPDQIELFVVISILVSLALLPISLSNRPAPNFEEPEPASIKEVYSASPLGVTGVLVSGISGGILFGMAPVFAMQNDFSIAQTANFMAAFAFGGMISQYPLGYLSDYIGRRKVIILTSALASLFALLCFVVTNHIMILYGMMFMLGAFALSIYGVCAAYTNDRLPKEKFVAASSRLILMNGASAFSGPFIASLFMAFFGASAFFIVITIVFASLSMFGLYRAYVSDRVALKDQGDSIAIMPRATPILAQIAEEDTEDGSKTP